MEIGTKDDYITVMFGGAGYYAVHTCTVIDDALGDYLDIVATGSYRGNDKLKAAEEAKSWAEATNMQYRD